MFFRKKKILQINTKVSEGVKELREFIFHYKKMAEQIKQLHQNTKTQALAGDMANSLKEMRDSVFKMAQRMGEIVDVYK